MKIAIVDIAGTVDEYSIYLSHSLTKVKDAEDEITLLCQTSQQDDEINLIRLFSLIPAQFKRSLSAWKRIVKALETIVNYVRLIIFVKSNHIDIVHFQWFPFLELGNVEIYVLKTIRWISPNTKIVYTHHNIYPHNSSETKKKAYKKRLLNILPFIDKFVVHNSTTKENVHTEFGIDNNIIYVQHHGIFYPREDFDNIKKTTNKKKILMYGMQSPYKGTDILVNAINLLPKEIKLQIEVEIVGRLGDEYLSTFREVAILNQIVINPKRISNKELYEKISSSDYLIYPYRKISQSGALLLGLYFNKIIVASDLPQFVETLKGFKHEWFFRSDSPDSLASLLQRLITEENSVEGELKIIEDLKKEYSWDNVAKSTLLMYKN